jgi:hypothetical protein
MADKGYNGWTNYETWNVALWLGNEEYSSRYWDAAAQDAYDGAPDCLKTFTKEEQAVLDLADMLKSEMEEANPLGEGASMFHDMLNAALSEVNWHEIAQHYIDEVDKEEETDDDEVITE